MASFMLLMLLVGSLAEPIVTNPSTTSYERAGNVRRVLDETTLEVKEEMEKLRTVSVIAINHPLWHAAALFQDQARVEAYAGPQVTSVQYEGLLKVRNVPYVPGEAPFGVSHPEDVDERIRVVRFNIGENFPGPNENEVAHFNASCEDHSETTIVIISDELCSMVDFMSKTSCGYNYPYIFRIYPSNLPSSPRYPYIPLGPRNTFPFAERSREIQLLASSRELLFNIMVSRGTSPRRNTAIKATKVFASEHPEIRVQLSGSRVSSEQWIDLLHQSKFTICPGGHNPETFRMYEALEAGSIPIVSRQDYLDPAYSSPHPCGDGPASWNTVAASPYAQAVSVDSWQELPQLLERLAQMSDDEVNELQVYGIEWRVGQESYSVYGNWSYSKHQLEEMLNPDTVKGLQQCCV